MSWTNLTVLAATRTDLGGWKWAGLPAGWVLVLVAILLFVGARALYRAERGRAGRATRLFLAAIRAGVLLLLLLVLAGPYREEVRTAEERSHLVLLVDASGSMGATDRYPEEERTRLEAAAWGEGAVVADGEVARTPRLELVRRVLGEGGEALLRELERRFVLHAYAFDVDWRGLGSTRQEAEASEGEDPVRRIAEAIGGLEASGGGTDLGTVLQSVAAEFLDREDRRLAGVLLITDGRDTSGDESPLEALASLGIQRRDLGVTPIALGNPASGRNLRVERIRAKDWVLIEDDVVFETALRHVGFTGVDGVRATASIVQVADAEGKRIDPPRPYEPPAGALLEIGPVQLGPESDPVPVRMHARMREAGTFRVTVTGVLPAEEVRFDSVAEDDEAVHEIRVVDQRIKVLYVDNFPRYELRFLRHWLVREPEPDPTRPEHRRRYEAHTLLQMADPTVEQDASPGITPLRSFPRTRRELFAYDVIVLGDIDWRTLAPTAGESREILALVRDFVDEGGGLALQAGANYKNPLSFRGTPLQDLLPVVVRDRDKNVSEDDDTPFRIALSDIGRRHPIFGVVPGRSAELASPDEVAEVWGGTAPWARFARDWEWWWMYRPTGGLRPGAVDLARARPDGPLDQGSGFLDDTGRPVVVFATMGYGKGRVFWSGLDAVWRIRRGQGDRYYGPFWDQVIRYLATYRQLGGNRRFKISTDKERYFAGETATVTVTALDRDYEPLGDAFLAGLHVEDPTGDDVLLTGDNAPVNVSPEGAAPGTFRTYLPLRTKGTYRLWIRDDTGGRGRGSRAEHRVEVEYRHPELRLTLPDHELLEVVRKETGGRAVDGRLARLYDLPRLARELDARTQLRVMDRHERPQWDTWWVLVLLVTLLGVEWAVRKRWQMI